MSKYYANEYEAIPATAEIHAHKPLAASLYSLANH